MSWSLQAVDEILSRGYEDHAEYHNQVTTWKADSVLLGEDVTASLLTHAVPSLYNLATCFE